MHHFDDQRYGKQQMEEQVAKGGGGMGLGSRSRGITFLLEENPTSETLVSSKYFFNLKNKCTFLPRRG